MMKLAEVNKKYGPVGLYRAAREVYGDVKKTFIEGKAAYRQSIKPRPAVNAPVPRPRIESTNVEELLRSSSYQMASTGAPGSQPAQSMTFIARNSIVGGKFENLLKRLDSNFLSKINLAGLGAALAAPLLALYTYTVPLHSLASFSWLLPATLVTAGVPLILNLLPLAAVAIWRGIAAAKKNSAAKDLVKAATDNNNAGISSLAVRLHELAGSDAESKIRDFMRRRLDTHADYQLTEFLQNLNDAEAYMGSPEWEKPLSDANARRGQKDKINGFLASIPNFGKTFEALKTRRAEIDRYEEDLKARAAAQKLQEEEDFLKQFI
ncbi:MAG: hypothetical protein WC632_02175 [Candidatus Margulisiibacteriota bacterium]